MAQSDLIVVGVDGSKHSRKALEWALDLAQTQHRPVLAVSTWSNPPAATDPPFASFPWGNSVDLGPATRDMLNAIVEEVGDGYRDVEVRCRAVAGNAAQELIRLSEEAGLVVVGARGHGGFVGMLIGSVSQHVLAHSRCTVVVVR